MESYGFSADLNRYLAKVLEDNGRSDLSGRWLDEITNGARSYDYWSKLVKDARAMTTNDIQVLAKAFDMTAFQWVANTRRHAAGQPVPVVMFNVGGADDDGGVLTREQDQEIRRSDVDIAALRGRNEADAEQDN